MLSSACRPAGAENGAEAASPPPPPRGETTTKNTTTTPPSPSSSVDDSACGEEGGDGGGAPAMAAAWAALASHISSAGGDAAPVTLAGEATSSSGRGLATVAAVPAGGRLIRLPWSLALTPDAALAPGGAAEALLGRAGRARLVGLVARGHPALLPHGTPAASILLLALGLLRDFREAPTAGGPRGPYAALLPTPPGSRLAAVASAGPAATDLLLFEEGELEALAAPALAGAVRAEAARLASLHAALFPDPDPPTPVSLPSFTWAHALVRSRALDLGGRLVLLPAIDFAQHDGDRGASAALFVRFPAGTPGDEGKKPPAPLAVDLMARRPYPAHSHVCLDYGRRALRDLLRTYAFVPPPPPPPPPGPDENAGGVLLAPTHADVFEDWVGEGGADPDVSTPSSGLEALVIDGGAGSTGAWLVEARILAAPGADQALLGGAARVVWVVKREPVVAGGAPRVVVHGVESGDDDGEDPTGRTLAMQPAEEAAAAGRLARVCEALARRLESEREKARRARRVEARVGAGVSFFRTEHARLAEDYVAARVALLAWAAAGLRDQAAGWWLQQ